jgi:hypothetical protein
MDADGFHWIGDDLAEGALEAWIEAGLAELEVYLALVAGSESAKDETA